MKPGTPTPWHTSHKRTRWATGENTPVWWTGGLVAEFKDEKDAAYIVHAANLYPELVEALRDGLSYSDGRIPAVARWRNDIRALLAKCDGAL